MNFVANYEKFELFIFYTQVFVIWLLPSSKFASRADR